jgi:hypothetical protein
MLGEECRLEIVSLQWLVSCFLECKRCHESLFPVPSFLGCVVCCTNFEKADSEKIKETVISSGGSFSYVFDNECTHLVARTKSGQKYEYAIQFHIPVVNRYWVTRKLETNGCVDDASPEFQTEESLFAFDPLEKITDALDSMKLEMLNGQIFLNHLVCIIGYPLDAWKKMSRPIILGGGFCLQYFHPLCSHLCVGPLLAQNDSLWYSPFRISPHWILDSCTQKKALSALSYQETGYPQKFCEEHSVAKKRKSTDFSSFQDQEMESVAVLQTSLMKKSVFSGISFAIECIKDCEKLESLIVLNGGTVLQTRGIVDVDYVVMEEMQSHNSQITFSCLPDLRPKLVTPLWLHKCVEEQRRLEYFTDIRFIPFPKRKKIFQKQRIHLAITQFTGEERHFLLKCARSFGINASEDFSTRDTTHFVYKDQSSLQMSEKYQKALQCQVPILSLAWFFDSIMSGVVQNTDPYELRCHESRPLVKFSRSASKLASSCKEENLPFVLASKLGPEVSYLIYDGLLTSNDPDLKKVEEVYQKNNSIKILHSDWIKVCLESRSLVAIDDFVRWPSTGTTSKKTRLNSQSSKSVRPNKRIKQSEEVAADCLDVPTSESSCGQIRYIEQIRTPIASTGKRKRKVTHERIDDSVFAITPCTKPSKSKVSHSRACKENVKDPSSSHLVSSESQISEIVTPCTKASKSNESRSGGRIKSGKAVSDLNLASSESHISEIDSPITRSSVHVKESFSSLILILTSEVKNFMTVSEIEALGIKVVEKDEDVAELARCPPNDSKICFVFRENRRTCKFLMALLGRFNFVSEVFLSQLKKKQFPNLESCLLRADSERSRNRRSDAGLSALKTAIELWRDPGKKPAFQGLNCGVCQTSASETRVMQNILRAGKASLIEMCNAENASMVAKKKKLDYVFYCDDNAKKNTGKVKFVSYQALLDHISRDSPLE